jgi:nicotinamidase-related amidase
VERKWEADVADAKTIFALAHERGPTEHPSHAATMSVGARIDAELAPPVPLVKAHARLKKLAHSVFRGT